MNELTAQATIKRSRLGVMPFPRGDYSSTITDYYWNDSKRDLVYYNKLWYAVKKFDPFNPVPKGSVPSSSSVYWELTTQFSMLVAGSVLAEHLAAGAITVDMLKEAIEEAALNINNGNLIIYGNGSIEAKKSGYFKSYDDKGNYCSFQNGRITGYSSAVVEGITIESKWDFNMPTVTGSLNDYFARVRLESKMISKSGEENINTTEISAGSIEFFHKNEYGQTARCYIDANGIRK